MVREVCKRKHTIKNFSSSADVSHITEKTYNSTSQCTKLQRLCTIVHCYCYWKAWRNVLSCQWGREIRKFGSNELMILFILPPLDWKMDVYSVNFSEERRIRSIDRLTLWLRANARSQRQRFHLLTVDFDPYQLDSSSRLTYSWERGPGTKNRFSS